MNPRDILGRGGLGSAPVASKGDTMNMTRYCDHVWVERYTTDFDQARLSVFCECSMCNVRGESFSIKVPQDEVDIKRNRALENARRLCESRPSLVKAKG